MKRSTQTPKTWKIYLGIENYRAIDLVSEKFVQPDANLLLDLNLIPTWS